MLDLSEDLMNNFESQSSILREKRLLESEVPRELRISKEGIS